MASAVIAKEVKISGIVQGVGFRPFVYQLSDRYSIKGRVANTSEGVLIHAEGWPENIETFCHDLKSKPPPLAHITDVTIAPAPHKGATEFVIDHSQSGSERATLISPDVALCDDCLKELQNPMDRRAGYPFINCTNCGPRYTIIAGVPYDRPLTAMKHFNMCAGCQAEYDNPLDRRFHAQPNACFACGPQVALYETASRRIPGPDPIGQAIRLLQQGFIIAVKGLGGFHLAVDAANEEAVIRLRCRKLREEKPFALMARDMDTIRCFAHISEPEQALLKAIQRPIVLLKKRKGHRLAENVAPRNRFFGVMLPYTPLHHLLLEGDLSVLVMTSANKSDEPIVVTNKEAFRRLDQIADYFMIHDRDIYQRCDDSIVRVAGGSGRLLRRSRGYVPKPVFLRQAVPATLACGAELKNTVCLTKGNQAFLSQHIGDLENVAAYDFYRNTIEHLQRILDIAPEIVAYDLHPDYLSTQFAQEESSIPKVGVQHHHAHIVSCMAENHISGPLIGLALDGTGYGSDGKIWGGEVLIADEIRSERAAHIAYTCMPGSAAAIRAPWRMAVSYLDACFGNAFRQLDLPLLKRVSSKKVTIVQEMMRRQINAPETSSLGRLFDGVAAIIGLRMEVSYEGQAAMELEMLADKAVSKGYDYQWTEDQPKRLLPQPIIQGVATDVLAGLPLPVISAKFHDTLVDAFTDICEALRREERLQRVALSGGVFQNKRLLEGLLQRLEQKGFQVFTHRRVPTNDGGIALGQAVVAAISHK